MTDPIAAMITMMKNASHAGKTVVTVPHSKVKEAIVVCLKRNGFVSSYETKIRNERPFLDITISAKNGDVINDVKRVSKPSRRMYKGNKEIRMYKNGAGSFIFSTPKGILTDKEARKEMVGGEILFSIW